MLTQHNYKEIDKNWDKKIEECCKKENPDDPKCTECCYDAWRAELKIIYRRYGHATERANQLSKKLVFFTERRNKYKTWLEELDKANDLARKICDQLSILAVQSDKIWYNSCKAVEAIEILFCMIRDFYMQIDYLKKRYDELQRCITQNPDSSLVKGTGILKALEEYGAKLDAVIKTRDDIIKFIVDAIRISNLIRNNISTLECPRDKNNAYKPCDPNPKPCQSVDGVVYYGFKTIICEWYNAFKCDVECEGENQNGQTQTGQGQTQTQTIAGKIQGTPPEECSLEPAFEFPLCNDNYRKTIYSRYEDDIKKVNKLTKDLNDANKEKEALLACKNGLDKAIKEADPKERCKS